MQKQVARVMALGVRAISEINDFARDMHQYDTLVREADGQEAREDQVVLRRLALAQRDPVRSVDVAGAVRGAAAALVARAGGAEPLLAACHAFDETLVGKVEALLGDVRR